MRKRFAADDWKDTVTSYCYSDLYELTMPTFLQGTANAQTWNVAYNTVGQPMSVSAPNGMVTNYQYDSKGVMTDLLHKLGGVTQQGYSYQYDDAYNITRITQEDGSYWTYGYDGRYRLTSAVRHNASDTERASYTYAYDAGDNTTSKTEPWVDDFSDGSITDNGWTVVLGTWSYATVGCWK